VVLFCQRREHLWRGDGAFAEVVHNLVAGVRLCGRLYQVSLWHVILCHVMSCHVMSCHVMSCDVMSCDVISCYFV
jgi:hypothetical protein